MVDLIAIRNGIEWCVVYDCGSNPCKGFGTVDNIYLQTFTLVVNYGTCLLNRKDCKYYGGTKIGKGWKIFDN